MAESGPLPSARMELLTRLAAVLGPNFRVERELGGGGMSRVFLARDSALNRDVVVKLLPPELAAGVSTERFKREINIAASLQHPHIVPVLSAGEVDELPFYMMPFVRGESLRERLDRDESVPTGEALSILRDVARALAYAHRQGVAHRDVKPENVLLTDGVAVVADFGIAKALSAAGHPAVTGTLTRTGTSVGTPAYMAPEQAAGDAASDHRADIYAFGVVAYELLAGKPPFHGATPRELLAAQMVEIPRPIEELREKLPGGIARLIGQCLEKDPAARPQSADELTREIEMTLSDSGELADALADEPRRIKRALALYSAASIGVVSAAWIATIKIGLPDWVVPGAILLVALALPLVALTGLARLTARRALAVNRTQSQPQRSWDAWMRIAVGTSRHLSWRRVAAGGISSLAAFGAIVAGFMILRAAGIGPVGSLLAAGHLDAMGTIIVSDFASAPEDSTLARLATESVRLGLAQSGVVRVMAPRATADALVRMRREPGERITREVGLEIARRESIRAVVAGDVTRSGRDLLLTVRLLAADSANTLSSSSALASSPGDLIEAADKVSRDLRGAIGESLRKVRESPRLERVTTASLAALDKYTQGARANDVELDFVKAVALLKEAVAIDTTFASAWRKLSLAYSNGRIPPPGAGADAMVRAYRHRGRLTEYERLLVEGAYFVPRDRGKAIAAYEQVVRLDSSNAGPLANLLMHQRDFARSETLLRRVLRDGSDSPIPYQHFVGSLMNQGKVREADSVAEFAAQRFPTLAFGRAEVRCAAAPRAECERLMRELRASGIPAHKVAATRVLAQLALLHGELVASDRLYAEVRALDAALRGSPEDPGPRLILIDTWITRRPERAAMRLDSMSDPPPLFLAAKAEAYALAGRADRARELLARLQRAGDSAVVNDGQVLLWVKRTRAYSAFAEGRWRDALSEFRAADIGPHGPANACTACLPLHLARTYDRMRLADSAIVMYERYLATPQYPRMLLDVFHLADAYERLSVLYEEVGNRTKAAEYATRFIELWENADPELQPRVVDARRRLSRVSPSPRPPAARSG